ncbi:XRE family transcriptional regulator [Ktedonosporobacter rubrisoli]|uniref:XRE family transcriptional regulator n=1 Tax=Ktedonosporobacter rubrisoli TaxID=2509675 RepID=A0A4P6JK87_KTERU|nr:helix-turn-helix transcriptional regulator [Ktedonosporobacter rubrisoli]QBD75380.1 XRE family transcriptional regulator [Ktedonosporobacter rubrisoli]
MKKGSQRHQELANFLRTKRCQLTPEAVGLPRGPRRRASGLRREEVAQLAGIGVAWYTSLEQGREIGVSPQTLESLARALHLNNQEREYLFVLALRQVPLEDATDHESVSPDLQHFLNRLGMTPGYVVGLRWNVIAWNEAANAIFGPLAGLRGRERNELWRVFTSSTYRNLFADWEEHARSHLARFRASCGRIPNDPWLARLIEDLLQISPQFREWWPQHDVFAHTRGPRLLIHPHVGKMYFEHLVFQVQDAPDLKIIVYTPLEQEQTPLKLRHLLNSSSIHI